MNNLLIITCIFCISTSPVLAQDKLQLELKDAPKPDIYIDGKKYDHAIFELLDQSKIATIHIIKDEQAIKKYNAPNGVIVIKSKKAAQNDIIVNEIEVKIPDSDKDPVIIIDGKVSDQESLSKLSPDDIESLEVVKGEKAMDQYNAPYGVVIVKTKD